MTEKYHIIFEGNINSGENIEKVKERLIKLYKDKTKPVEVTSPGIPSLITSNPVKSSSIVG